MNDSAFKKLLIMAKLDEASLKDLAVEDVEAHSQEKVSNPSHNNDTKVIAGNEVQPTNENELEDIILVEDNDEPFCFLDVEEVSFEQLVDYNFIMFFEENNLKETIID